MSVNDILSIKFLRCCGDIPVEKPINISIKIEFDKNISPSENYDNNKDLLKSALVEIFTNLQSGDENSFWEKKMKELRR